MPEVTIEANDLAVLEALLWWCKGFRSAFAPGFCNMPNIVAMDNLKDRMAQTLERSKSK